MKFLSKIYFPLVFLFLLSTSYLYSQNSSEQWIEIELNKPVKLFVDIYGLQNFSGDEFYVWTKQLEIPPLELENYEKEIYSTLTYYLINKKVKKYSILEVIYYDENNNVLDDFKYENKSLIEGYRYNFPIMPNTEMESVYNKCLTYLGNH